MFLEDAADELLGKSDASKIKSKVRRLYDISNILSSLKLVEKIAVPSGKPRRRTAFRWIGLDLHGLTPDPSMWRAIDLFLPVLGFVHMVVHVLFFLAGISFLPQCSPILFW